MLQRLVTGKYTGIFIVLLSTLLFSLLIFFVERKSGGDDVYFAQLVQDYPTLYEWLHYRYHAWSARLLPETFMYYLSAAPLRYWKIITVISFFATGLMLLQYYKLVRYIRQSKRYYMDDLTVYVFIGLFFFLMGLSVFAESILWVTGAMNYMWLVPLLLAALYPVVSLVIRGNLPNLFITIPSVVLSGLVAASSE